MNQSIGHLDRLLRDVSALVIGSFVLDKNETEDLFLTFDLDRTLRIWDMPLGINTMNLTLGVDNEIQLCFVLITIETREKDLQQQTRIQTRAVICPSKHKQDLVYVLFNSALYMGLMNKN